ncbi:MAG: MoxR family ATPase [Chlamydiia bacterium]|nr:MoxR family ATPase [Chlamydiia bacterium]
MDLDRIKALVQEKHPKVQAAREEMAKIIVGQRHLVDRLLIALLADGHVLVEGLPGLAKTLAVNTLAQITQCSYKRIQFTPDLLPADLIGTSIFNPQKGEFEVRKGPIFTHILVADEINRAPAKVQSALLEVMQERKVTISGERYDAKSPYFVMATQNPIESEGTYPLPEAQTDRFMMKVTIDYPNREEEETILKRMGTLGPLPQVEGILSPDDILDLRKVVEAIHLDEKIEQYILDLVIATRDEKHRSLLLFGASPRASLALKIGAKAHAFLEGRPFVTPFDVKSLCHEVFRHRLRRTFEAEAENISSDAIIDTLLKEVIPP